VIHPDPIPAPSGRQNARPRGQTAILALSAVVAACVLALSAFLAAQPARAADEPTAEGQPAPGPTPVRFFGAEGKGYKFVYVLDRSGSMGGSGAKALRAAKAELLAS